MSEQSATQQARNNSVKEEHKLQRPKRRRKRRTLLAKVTTVALREPPERLHDAVLFQQIHSAEYYKNNKAAEMLTGERTMWQANVSSVYLLFVCVLIFIARLTYLFMLPRRCSALSVSLAMCCYYLLIYKYKCVCVCVSLHNFHRTTLHL